MTRECVRVALAERAYDIHIGERLLDQAGALLAPLVQDRRVVVVTDEHVADAQGARLKAGLAQARLEHEMIALAPGEGAKSFKQLESLTGRLLELGVERGDLIVAFGGGVIGDLVGFAAAILRRGCRFAQVPTTLLAQVDSAVGGKTAINAKQGKNLIGAFHQPSLVIADVDALATLTPREMRAGYAEVVKYGLIADAPFFAWLEANGEKLLAGDRAAQIHAVKKCCELKAKIVGADEREAGVRALLNFGHTFAHAFEALYGYDDRLLHGEGVALGISLALEFSARQGLLSAEDQARARTHLARTGLPVAIGELCPGPALDAARLAAWMMQDKKVERGKLTLVLAKSIGEAVIVKDASLKDIEAFLEEKIARNGR